MTPTNQSYSELQTAFDFFNERLFGGMLPPCLITLQRKNRSYGYFSHRRFSTNDQAQVTDEIAMNPTHFWERPLLEVLSTLGHEMVHAQQYHFGQPSRGGYHNRQWADWMEQIGLMPSDTGEPGGKRTGQHMTHYIITGGAFEQAAKELLATGLQITWGDGHRQQTGSGRRGRFICPRCGLRAQAKPSARLDCGTCQVPMS